MQDSTKHHPHPNPNNPNNSKNYGWVQCIVGCMFSGKTEELIKIIKRYHLAKQKFQAFKPCLDNRYLKEFITSHNQLKIPCTSVEGSEGIIKNLHKDTQVVAIDEAQFFDKNIINVIQYLSEQGRKVIVAGLDTDYLGRPFQPVPQIMAIADDVKKEYAVCSVCGELATRSYRLVSSQQSILVGSGEVYQARCKAHFDVPHQPVTLQDLEPNLASRTGL